MDASRVGSRSQRPADGTCSDADVLETSMAQTLFKGTPVNTVGDLPSVGSSLPEFELTGTDLSPITNADLAGKRVVLNIFPSLDTGTCAMSVRTFNERASALENTTVVCASADLPFAQARFCGAEGIKNVVTGSSFKTSFADDFGTRLVDGPLEGLNTRAVVVADADGTVLYTQLVGEITEEPDYDAALAALN